MNWQIIEGNWQHFGSKLKDRWGNLTDAQLDLIAGKRTELVDQIRRTYGISHEEAEDQIRRYEKYRP
jgi:uncharacterized protein YjbJ (UPF0337 family)